MIIIYLGPIGSTKPKLSEDLNLKGMSRELGQPVTLVCPAQGFPVPAFRLEFYFGTFKLITLLNRSCGYFQTKIFWGYQLQKHHQNWKSSCYFDLPSSGSSNPSIQACFFIIKLNCLGPVGSSKPAFSSAFKSFGLSSVSMTTIALLCPAQGSPVPKFR